MELEFHTLDVFTKNRFGGNPLAVVLGADGLSTEMMQAIANGAFDGQAYDAAYPARLKQTLY